MELGEMELPAKLDFENDLTDEQIQGNQLVKFGCYFLVLRDGRGNIIDRVTVGPGNTQQLRDLLRSGFELNRERY